MNLELENRVVVLTGATGGIGSQIAIDYLAEGAIVACLIRNESKMQSLRNQAEEAGLPLENLHSFKCNLIDSEDIKRVTSEVVEKLESIHILVNCAGYADEMPFGILGKDDIDKMIDLNLKSPIYLTQAVLKPMFRQKDGCIINISSISSVKKGRGITVYAAAKAGLEAFSRTLSIEVGRKNIRVNSIRPGVITTTMSGPLLERASKLIENDTALSRPGNADEISAAVLFISSNKTASYMTGESISIDGGLQ